MFIRHIPDVACYTSLVARLSRYYGAGYLHFITTSCYRRLPLLEQPQHRDQLLEVLERVRRPYQFVIVGYVIMARARAPAAERTRTRRSVEGHAGDQAGVRATSPAPAVRRQRSAD